MNIEKKTYICVTEELDNNQILKNLTQKNRN